MEAENKILELKLKKAMILSDIDGLEHVEQSLFTLLGKTEAEIHKLQKMIVNQPETIFQGWQNRCHTGTEKLAIHSLKIKT